MNDFTNPS
ncbi:Protein of unknown function [Lactobacillus helveticus CIRM-BIA 103]|nr:Protein of unknown function [Lactobacillus helveticus CIRM-BIA 103]